MNLEFGSSINVKSVSGSTNCWKINCDGTATFCGFITGTINNSCCVGGLLVHAGINCEPNKIVRTDASGYIQAGYIASTCGNENNASNPPRVWGTNGSDNYLRTYTTGKLCVLCSTNSTCAVSAITSCNTINQWACNNIGTYPIYNCWNGTYFCYLNSYAGVAVCHADNATCVSSVPSGSLTTNYVPKWNGTCFANSSIFDCGCVGIGTATPTGKLHVFGYTASSFPATTGTAQTGLITRLQNCDTNGILDIGMNAGSGAWLQATNITNLASNYPLLLNPNGGNVGIGMTNPSAMLHVNGNVYVQSTNGRIWGINGLASGHTVNFQYGGDSFNSISTTWGSYSEFKSYHGVLYTANSNCVAKIGCSNGGTTSIFYGNVGVGTTVPRGKLEVVSGTANINADAAAEFTVVGANQAIATNCANVQIASNCNQAADMGGSLMFGGRYFTSCAGQANYAAIKGGKSNSTSGDYSGYLAFGTRLTGAVTQERMRIDCNGNVGIGTTTPDTYDKLSVYGSSAAVVSRVTNTLSSGEAALALTNNVGYAAMELFGSTTGFGSMMSFTTSADITNGMAFLSLGTTAPIKFHTAGSSSTYERMRITSTGNVGIGTNAPASRLSVVVSGTSTTNLATFLQPSISAGNVNAIMVGQSLSTNNAVGLDFKYVGAGCASNVGFFSMYGSNSIGVYGNGGVSIGGTYTTTVSPANGLIVEGNVGIGITCPSSQLTVGGTGRILLVPTTATSNAFVEFCNTGGDSYLGMDNSAGGLSGTAYAMTMYAGGTVPISLLTCGVNRLHITNTGLVGIGTTTPQYKLSITAGSSTPSDFSGSMVITTGTGAYTDESLLMGVHNSDYSYIQAAKPGTSVRNLILNGAGGNVGIGTTTPLKLLHLEAASNPLLRFHQIGANNWDIGAIGYSFAIRDDGNGFNPIFIEAGGGYTQSNSAGNILISNPNACANLNLVTVGGGNVSIGGTCSYGLKLGVRGGGTFMSPTFDNCTNGGTITIFQDNANYGSIWSQKNGNSAWGDIAIAQLGGNVGVGTTTPSKLLSIKGASATFLVEATSGNPMLEITNDYTSSTRKEMYLGYDMTSDFGFIQAIHQNTLFTPIVLQPDGGNVGIGNTTPLGKLDVGGTSPLVWDYCMCANTILGGIIGSSLLVRTAGYGCAWGAGFGVDGAQENGEQTSVIRLGAYGSKTTGMGGALAFITTKDSTATERMRIDKDGNVGIGTCTPTAHLQVNDGKVVINSTSGGWGQLQLTNANACEVTVVLAASVSAGWGGALTSACSDYVWAFGTGSFGATSNKFVIGNNGIGGAALTVVAPSGNVGIGTTCPLYKLQVNGGFYQNDTSKTSFFDGIVCFGGTTSYKTIIDNNGTVGIGTATPSAKLHVNDITGSGTTVVKVEGSQGELFTIVDDLTGIIHSVNDNVGIPILTVNSDTTVTIDGIQKINSTIYYGIAADSVVAEVPIIAGDAAYFDYYVKDSSNNMRAGTVMAVWDGVGVQFIEQVTPDLNGSTGGINFDVVVGTTMIQLNALIGGETWTIKVGIRLI